MLFCILTKISIAGIMGSGLMPMTTIIVERSSGRRVEVRDGVRNIVPEVFKARIEGDTDANAVWAGKSAAEAVGWLVIHLGFSLQLRIIQRG